MQELAKPAKDKEKSEKAPKPVAIADVQAFLKKIHAIFTHIDNVKEAGKILVDGLAERGMFDLALRLAARLYRHDNSKFSYIEWMGILSEDTALQKLAIDHHRRCNEHHIQYHCGGHRQMSDLDIAEWACDIKARGGEMGTDVREYVDKFLELNNISKSSNFYKKANFYFSIILEKPFKAI